MKRFTKVLLTTVVFSVSASSAMVADAGCHGRSGGYSSGHSYGSTSYSGVSSYPSQSYNSYNYSPPVYVSPPQQQVVYPQPVVQPAYQPQYLSPYGAALTQSSTMPVNGFPVGPTGFPQSQQQQFGQQQPQMTQPQMAQPQQQFAQQQTTQQQQPQLQPQIGTQPQAQPQVASGNSAELSALQALGAFAPPQTEVQQTQQTVANTQPNAQPIIGTWTARLSNGAIVQLNLQADGNFNWTATNASGSTSAFQGQYQINNGSLILNRSSDNQRLTGSTAMNGNDAFSFRLSDSNAASLEFQRS